MPFIKRGIPTFVDKPFCCRAVEGRAFLEIAQKAGTPVTSFSVLPEQMYYAKFLKRLAKAGKIIAGTTFGPCDPNSSYGGIFFTVSIRLIWHFVLLAMMSARYW
ncbi:MAG: hypothetical protein ACYC54_15655 [Sedimentisphaerales bacterium]